MSNAGIIRTNLLKRYSSTDKGIWHIKGEDPNCDFGGHHSQPSLGFVSGEYRYVVEYALTLDQFITWGSGGDIKMIDVKPIDRYSVKTIADARERVRRLDDQLHNAKEALKRLEGE